MTQIKAYQAKYVKQNGEVREIKFVKANELPKEFADAISKGSGKARVLKEGQELVWDLDKADYRILNTKTIIGNIEELDLKAEFKEDHTDD